MYSRPTTPKTIGGVLDDIFTLYKPALAASWPIALIVAVVTSLPGFYMAMHPVATQAELIAMVMRPAFWSFNLISMILNVVFYGALLARVDAVANQRESSIAEAINTGLRLGPRLLGASILYGLAIIAGMILLVVPGVIWSISLMLFSVLIVAEGLTVGESFSRSRQMIKGSWWRTATILTIALIVAYLLLFCVQFIVGFVGGVNKQADLMGVSMLSTVVSGALYIVVFPFIGATSFSIYFDLKLRKDGDDLTQRMGSLT